MRIEATHIPHSSTYWGKRFGGYYTEKDGWNLPKAGFGSSHTNTGKTINTPLSLQSKQDKEKYALMVRTKGRPVIIVKPNNRRDYEKEKEETTKAA